MSDHQHEKLTAAKRKIAGGGFISLEVCKCGAMRSVVQKGATGPIVNSDWEEREEDEEPIDLLWDGGTENDNE